MEKFTPSELCADIKIYDYKQKVKYDEKSLVIFEKTGKMITAGKECEGMLYTLPANSIGFLRSCWEESATIPVRKRC